MKLATVLGVALVLGAPAASASIDIVFDYSYDSGSFFNIAQKNILDQAAGVFESRLSDKLTAVTSGGSNSFDVNFINPSGGASVTLNNYSVAADQIVVYVGAQSLGTNTLGEGGPGGYGAGGTQAFVDNAGSRGQAGALATPATDYGPWGGTLSFNSAANWIYASGSAPFNNGGNPSGYDFYSVALHELGHVLGVGTAASWNTWVNGGSFTGPASEAVHGGTVPLDGDLAHWADGTLSPINGVGSFEAAMDPSIANDTRKNFTDLDFAALKDIGWQVSAVPEAQTWAMLLAGLLLVGAALRRRA